MPIASTRPNIVNTLIDSPNAHIATNAPISVTGITTVGTSA
jgi:hypothetical protein